VQDFEGKVAVVTGTANPRGIGMAIVRRLADSGCKVVLADLSLGSGQQPARHLADSFRESN
jgi:NAD(P)-dependent dehydrogenase (short-subunit alcohol dehydrogenase family)